MSRPSQSTPHAARLEELAVEIAGLDKDISKLKVARQNCIDRRNEILRSQMNPRASAISRKPSMGISVLSADVRMDYYGQFEWSQELRLRMKTIFNIDDFRLCQEGVCNANMDGRDIICIMPTGGGKSLTYQLPALLTPGCTVVISPLIALMTDQIMHLTEAGVEAVMLTGSKSRQYQDEVLRRLEVGRRALQNSAQKEIKLCYVTPEKMTKDKRIMEVFARMSQDNRLARFVIDEAHCVSSLGHDFRPDYKSLSELKKNFPKVPILALSATCPPRVLTDLLATLRLGPKTDGKNASLKGTVSFSSPLYRRNLHYRVLAKPNNETLLKLMTEYIRASHPNETGIIYCLSQADAEKVAKGILEESGGKIKTGVYHAGIAEDTKAKLHEDWTTGKVQVVCATIAFGLGVDKADVRFVLHHSLPTSLENYYQESGRAGRDGKDAECILYYKAHDAFRRPNILMVDLDGQTKIHRMLQFAQDLEECRNVHFARHFSDSADRAMAAWTADSDRDGDTLARCGHCDNCTRPPETIDARDVTLDAWRVLRVVQRVAQNKRYVTLPMLTDLVRGAQNERTLKLGVDVHTVARGKVALRKEDAEALVIRLLLANYLRETCLTSDYGTVVYLVLGPCAERLLDRRTPADVEALEERVVCVFERPARRQAPRRSRVSHAAERSRPTPGAEVRVRKGSASRTRKRKRVKSEYDESVIFSLSESESEDEDEDEDKDEDADADADADENGGGEAGSSSRGRAPSFSFPMKKIVRAAEDEHSESESLTVIGDVRSAAKRKRSREATEGARSGKQRGSLPRRKGRRRQMGMFAIDDDDDDDDKMEAVNEGKNYWIPNMRDSVPPQSGWNARQEEPIEISSD